MVVEPSGRVTFPQAAQISLGENAVILAQLKTAPKEWFVAKSDVVKSIERYYAFYAALAALALSDGQPNVTHFILADLLIPLIEFISERSILM